MAETTLNYGILHALCCYYISYSSLWRVHSLLLFVYSPTFLQSHLVFISLLPLTSHSSLFSSCFLLLTSLLFSHPKKSFSMDSPEKRNHLAFGVTSFPSSTPHQDNNQSGPRQRISFTFPPTQASGGFSQWASSSAGLLNASSSANHAPDVSEKNNPSSPECKMELDAAETAPRTATAGALPTLAVAVRGDQVRGDSLLASRAISPDQNGMSGEASLIPVAADASRACVVFEPEKVSLFHSS